MSKNTEISIKENRPLLEVKDFSLAFSKYQTGIAESKVKVIKKINLTINSGEIVAVVGSSGSGKSLFADSILGILPDGAQSGGTILFNGEPLTPQTQQKLRGKEISLIPQSLKSLDPLIKTGKQVQSVIPDKKNRKKIQEEAFLKLNLPQNCGDKYPFELSGGMARRVLIATAMVSGAKLIIADEPTPGLDKKSWEETLAIIKQLSKENIAVMFITHDIYAALKIADRIAVFYNGETIEIAQKDFFCGKGEKLRHNYTKALWNALPENDFDISERDKIEYLNSEK